MKNNIINLKPLLEHQKKENIEFMTEKSLTYSEIKNKVRLALMVELMELSNEVRAFNYWSLKKRGDEADIAAELSDVLFFTALMAIEEYNIEFNSFLEIEAVEPTYDKEKLTLKFLKIISLYSQIKDLDSLLTFLKNVIELGYMLDLDFDQQLQARFKKSIEVKKREQEH